MKPILAVINRMILCMLLLACISSTCYAEEAADVVLTVEGTNGTVNELMKDGIHYLILPRDISLSGLIIHSNNKICYSSSGIISDDELSVTGDFSNKDEISLTIASGDNVHAVILQSELPSVCISLNGVTQDEINSGSKEIKYPGNEIYITDNQGIIDTKTDEDNLIEVKGRGNSSWGFPKRPYQIRFARKMQVLGMKKAKKWLLLAADDDGTLLRDKTAFCISRELGMAGTPELKKVDLWIDGNYQGNYSLCQKISTDSSSLNLGDEGVLVELDNRYYETEEDVFASTRNNQFVLKESNCDDRTEELKCFDQFCKKIDAFEDALYVSDKDWDKIKGYIDENSWAKYYLMQEFAENYDGMVTSTFFYTDGVDDEIHIGPVWDMGIALGNNGNQDIEGDFLIYGKRRKIRATYYEELEIIKEFRVLVKSIFENEFIDAVAETVPKLDTDALENTESAYMNYNIRWPNRLGHDNIDLYRQPYGATYQENIDVLREWLIKRVQYMGPFDEGILPQNKVSIDSKKFVYTGKTITPKLTIEGLKKGYDYSVIYPTQRTNVGTYKIKINGINRYSGTIIDTFQIVPASSAIRSIESKNLSLYVKATTGPANKGGSRYQIAYRQKGKKTWEYITTSTDHITIKRLTKNKQYYVKIRAYKKVDTKTFYGSWSKAKLSKKIK